MQEHLYTAP